MTVTQKANAPFSLEIKNSAGAVIYKLEGMVLSEYFNYIDSTVYTDWAFKTGIMGLQEKVSNNLFLDDGVYSLWARDNGEAIEDGKAPGKNIYGTHPFYMGAAPLTGA